jgi:hypothetical protein
MDFGNREKAGKGTNYCALDFSSIGEKVNFYKLKEGSNKLDVVPYIASSKLHPLIASGRLEKGSPDYDLEIFVHRNIGASGGSYICPKKLTGAPCPICEAAEALDDRVKGGDKKAEDTQKKLFPSFRIFMNVVDMMDEDKGVQLFETNNKQFLKPLKAAQAEFNTDADAQAEHPKAHFADPDNGLTIKVIGGAATFGGHDYVEPSSVTLLPRKNDMNDYLESAIALDKCIKVLSYEELEAIFTGAVEEDEPEEEEETPKPKAKKPAVEEDDEEPASKKSDKKAEVEEEDEPAPKSKKVCGAGHKWYKDNDEFPECEDCKLWKFCCKDTEPK